MLTILEHPLSSKTPDPIFGVIERHRELTAAFEAAVDVASGTANASENKAADAIASKRWDLLTARENELIRTAPRTLPGPLVLLRYWQEPHLKEEE